MAILPLGRRIKIIAGAVGVLACLAVLASYLYVRYADVVRFSAVHGRVTVDAAPAGKLGTVLVTNKGFALYMFAPDAGRQVTCTGDCATAWPPLLVHAGQSIAAGPGVRPDLLGTAQNPGGGRVVTYHGWPLYTYLGDAAPGHAAGQSAERRWRLLVRDAPLGEDRRQLKARGPSSHTGTYETGRPVSITQARRIQPDRAQEVRHFRARPPSKGASQAPRSKEMTS